MEYTGRILSGIGGLYRVETEQGVVECRARGSLRRDGLVPSAGDLAAVSAEGTDGVIERILPRRNAFVRPPVANVDRLVIVMSLVQPAPHAAVIDKMITIAESKGVSPVLVLNKIDSGDAAPWRDVYGHLGYPLAEVSAVRQEGIAELRRLLTGGINVFTGNSGVGKSSLLNALYPQLGLETGETSRKLGRGRHTTRSSCLYPQPDGGYVADTPGFSLLDMERAEWIPAEQLDGCFREFTPYLGRCRFAGCRHMEECDCAVREAVARGEIAASRYESYRRMRLEVEKRPAWERRAEKP